jgi:hypothetical protein
MEIGATPTMILIITITTQHQVITQHQATIIIQHIIIIIKKSMINKDEWYSMSQVVDQKLLPMFKSRYSVKKWIKAKKLSAVVMGEGMATTYKIKGSSLIMFIAKWESGDFMS